MNTVFVPVRCTATVPIINAWLDEHAGKVIDNWLWVSNNTSWGISFYSVSDEVIMMFKLKYG